MLPVNLTSVFICVIQASASIPYWPQNDGSSLELGEFTITKRFFIKFIEHHKCFSPSKYLLHEIISCISFFLKFLTYWLPFRFSSESGSYTTTTLQLTHGSCSHRPRPLLDLNIVTFRSEQKSEDSVAFAVQWLARPWLS